MDKQNKCTANKAYAGACLNKYTRISSFHDCIILCSNLAMLSNISIEKQVVECIVGISIYTLKMVDSGNCLRIINDTGPDLALK